ncbi:6389_t:CDS:2 [Cetraspora pellucida]|uniref:6389_t:CDS:1 n=1 Tax=Cetraspora pellucida TaxID=1433469 RepID=A0A9N9NGG1_9GLOM|nr:6389_t:CDS:2 [Cetraspora pellucida]
MLVFKDAIKNAQNDNDIDYSKGFLEDQLDRPQIKAPHVFTAEVQQCVQRKAKYSHSFRKIKKALNMTFDLKCEDEFINLIDKFIDYKKSSIESANKENMQVQISDSIVIKHCGCPLNKRIKALSESKIQHDRTNNSALNLSDPNLYI